MKYLCLFITILLTSFGYTSHETRALDTGEETSAFFGSDTINTSTGTYTIIKKLGEGAFGKVFKVQNDQGQTFAIKAYKKHNLSSKRSRDSTDNFYAINVFLDLDREFERGQILDHPNIIHSLEQFLYYTPENQEISCLVLEYVEGTTVGNVEKKYLPKASGILAASQLVEALNYALAFGYFHLDLHNQNAMLTKEGEIKVIDLASFFHIDELYSSSELFSSSAEYSLYPYRANNRFSYSSKEGYRTNWHHFLNCYFENAQGATSARVKSNAPLYRDEIKQGRFRALFERNPYLLREVRKAKVEMHNRQRARTKSTSPKGVLNKEALDATVFKELFLSYYKGIYLNMIAYMCSEILKRADIDTSERYYIRGEITKVAWEFEDDKENGIQKPIDAYLNKIMQILHASY